MKILYLYFGSASPVSRYEKNLVDQINLEAHGLKIDYFDWTGSLGLNINQGLGWTYKNKGFLAPHYEALLKKTEAYDVVYIAQTETILPEVMAAIKPFVIYNTADDPESSKHCSFPFLTSADMVVHAGVNFNDATRMGDEFLKRGAKRTYFMPIGFYEEMFPAIPNIEQQFYKRDIPLVFVGFPKPSKLIPFARAFGKNLHIYYRKLRFDEKIRFYIPTGKWIKPFTGSLSELYQRCQVGINMHYSYGPSNVRMYQLNAAGVAQVLDCPEGNSQLYVPGSEILSYKTILQGIEAVNTLLKDEELRYKLSVNGYKKARECYNRKDLLVKMLKSV